ncbi:MAG: cupin domain-containing protein [Bacteroidaceae bacterium]|nr:cupin domain-containing protein [Bacteroidaceae bacterium]
MSQEPFIIKHIDDIASCHTSHQVGVKTVLLGNDQPQSPITQIARTTLNAGDNIDTHTHDTMDEHFYILQGEVTFIIGHTTHKCHAGNYLLVRAGTGHALKATTDAVMLTIGIAL